MFTEEQRLHTIKLYKDWRAEAKLQRYHNSLHPIKSRLRDKLFSKLDVDLEILHYMRFPEFRFFFLPRVVNAPVLEGYVGAKVPLVEKVL